MTSPRVNKILVSIKENLISTELDSVLRQENCAPYHTDSVDGTIHHLGMFPDTGLMIISIDIALENNTRVFEYIREMRLTLPVILISRYLTVETIRIARMLNCSEILQDGMQPAVIRAVLTKYLQNHFP